MKHIFTIIVFSFTALLARTQMDTLTKTRIVIGLSVPELAHAGISFDLGKHNQLGMSAGIGPTLGGVWPSFNAEHRLYFGNLIEKTNRRIWFFRQGINYFPAGDDVGVTLSAGLDLRSKRRNNGWTIDAGITYLLPGEWDRYRNSFPSLRFQYYNYFKKKQ